MYVFDSSALIHLFWHYYGNREVFETLCQNFDDMVKEGKILSVKEVKNEITSSSDDLLSNWAKQNKNIFLDLTADEADFIKTILTTKNFSDNVKKQRLLHYNAQADSFVIAKAKTLGATVVSEELFKPNGAKIPNICSHFGVPHLNVSEFMKKENWKF